MDDKLLREAVEILKKDGYWGENKNVKAFDLLLSLAQLFLLVKGMPLKIEIPETRIATPLCEISFNKGRIQGRNQAIDACTAHLAGKLEGRKIQDIFLNMAKRVQVDDEENPGHWRWAWIIDYDDLAQAIKDYLMEEV